MSPDNDTLCVVAALDLRPGPLVLHVPDTADRYYVLQFADAWTNNLAYIGRRGTGTAERLVAPDDTTAAPEGMELVRAPTGVVTIVGPVQINGAADAAAVHPRQDEPDAAERGSGTGRGRTAAGREGRRGPALAGDVPRRAGRVPAEWRIGDRTPGLEVGADAR